MIDINPNKQGKYIPGTGHPILGVSALKERGIKNALLMNPNYQQENLKLLAQAGIETQLVLSSVSCDL